MAVSSRLRFASAVLLALVAVIALTASGSFKSAASGQVPGRLVTDAEERLLRLHDLTPGYRIGYDDICELISPQDSPPVLARFLTRNRAASCDYEYERVFVAPGSQPLPPDVQATTVSLRDATAATRFLALGLDELREPNGPREVTPPPAIGTEAKLFRSPGGRFRPASAVIWRQDRFVAAISVTGPSIAANDAAALRLAARQQERILAPTPYTEAERDDTEVELDDPSLKVPVYWLGRAFARHGLGTAKLQTATVIEQGGLPGSELILRYDGFNLETWTRQSWRNLQASFLGKLNRGRCTRTTAFEWEHGHALISAGYRRRTFEECPHYPPTRYWAVAHIGGVVIGVNQTTCRCLSPGFGAYSSSLRGMKAVLRGLTLRPKPVYATTSASR